MIWTSAILLTLVASMGDLAVPMPLPKSVAVLMIEGTPGVWPVPWRIMRQFHLHSGQTVSVETARLIAQELGAEYDAEDIEKLERLDR